MKRNRDTGVLSRRVFVGQLAVASVLASRTSRAISAEGDAPFDFYISPTGSDTNPGTLEEPWAITALSEKGELYAGKRVGLLDGTYRLYELCAATGWNNGGVTIPSGATGTQSEPTVIQAVNLHGVVVTGNNGANAYPDSNAPLLAVRAEWVEIRNLRFFQSHVTCISAQADNLLVERCWADDIDGTRQAGFPHGDNIGFVRDGGVFVRGLTVRNCLVEHVRNETLAGSDPSDYVPELSTNAACIGPMFNVVDILIENCTFKHAGAAFYPKRNESNYIFRYNFCYNLTKPVFGIDRVDIAKEFGALPAEYTVRKSECYGNVFVKCFNFDDYGPQAGQWANDLDLFHNTIVYQHSSSVLWGYRNTNDDVPERDITWNVYNNLFVVGSEGSLAVWFSREAASEPWPDRAGIWNFNGFSHFLSFRDRVINETWTSLSAWQAACGLDANSLESANVAFVGASDLSEDPTDYELSDSSAFRNAGRAGGLMVGAPVDMGAWGIAERVGHGFDAAEEASPPSPPTDLRAL
jgi:hypothetical protein